MGTSKREVSKALDVAIPFLFVLGGTLWKGFRRFGIPLAVVGLAITRRGYRHGVIISGLFLWGVLSIGYSRIFELANAWNPVGIIAVFLLGCLYSICTYYPLYFTYQYDMWLEFNGRLLVVSCGVISMVGFLLSKLLEGYGFIGDSWALWELSAGVCIWISAESALKKRA